MLTSAALYIVGSESNRAYCAKMFHDKQSLCPFPCHLTVCFDNPELATGYRKNNRPDEVITAVP